MLYPSLITNTQEVYDGGNKNTGRTIWWSSASVDRQKDNWGTSLYPTNLQEWNMAIAPWWFQEDHNWTCPGNDWKGKHLATKITKCYQNFASPLPIIAEEQPNVWSNYYYNWRCLKYRVRLFSLILSGKAKLSMASCILKLVNIQRTETPIPGKRKTVHWSPLQLLQDFKVLDLKEISAIAVYQQFQDSMPQEWYLAKGCEDCRRGVSLRTLRIQATNHGPTLWDMGMPCLQFYLMVKTTTPS